MLARIKVALKGQKLSISKLLPFQGDFVVSILKPRALPWAKSFCPFRAYGMWLMTHRQCILIRLIKYLIYGAKPMSDYSCNFAKNKQFNHIIYE